MAIELVTFGGLHILDDEGELDWLAGQRTRAALLVYIGVERRVSRESLTTVFWPESDAENARHALRQSLYHLRKAVKSDWVESRAHELAVTADFRADVHEFAEALARRDLESAVRLYRGPFLEGVHLVDLPSWESWVDSRRAHYARSFRKACRDLVESKRAAGDMAGAVRAAERWSSRDPLDDEAQHRLIETLAAAGERADAIRQYEAYARMMESEGFEIPTETRELAERVRSGPASIPVVSATSAVAADSPQHVGTAKRHEAAAHRFPGPAFFAAIGILGLVASAWSISRLKTERVPVASDIAVLPFSVHGAPSVGYLREGMVNLLTAALDGAGTLRPIDSRATFAAASDPANPATDPRNAERIAGLLGAGMYLVGDVVEAGGRLQINATIYRRGVSEPAARAVVSGANDSVFPLADRLAARLLAELSDPAADRLIRTASVATSSLPAFKEYLNGERLMRAGQFERAADSYVAAILHDSTFAVAYYRLGLAREWAPLLGTDRAAAAAAHYAGRLSPRDRGLLEAFRAWRSGDAVAAERAYRAILARYPDDVDAWFQLGEIQFHHGPLVGRPISESEAAWRKVLRYEPRNLFAVTHLARLALTAGRVAAVDSLLAPFPPEQLRADRRLTEIVLLRAVASGDTATLNAVVSGMRTWEDLSVWRVAVFLAAFAVDPARMRGLIDRLYDENASPALRAEVRWFASLLDLAGGRLNAARNAVAEAKAAERSVATENRRHGFDAVIEWFAATLPLPYADSMLARARQQAESWRGISSRANAVFNRETELGAPIQLEPVRQYTIGVISLRLRDTVSAAAAGIRLHDLAMAEKATVLTRDLDRGLRARLALQRGQQDESLRLLKTLESNDTQGDIAATPFAARAHERFLRGEILAATGAHTEALKWFASVGDGSVTEIPLRALSQLRQAQIHERLENRQQAIAHYTSFIRLWSNADAQFEPAVRAARQRLAALR